MCSVARESKLEMYKFTILFNVANIQYICFSVKCSGHIERINGIEGQSDSGEGRRRNKNTVTGDSCFIWEGMCESLPLICILDKF